MGCFKYMHNKGKVVASYTYDAWGVCKIVSDSTGIIARINPFRNRSYYYYQEIGLYYLQSRYYDACVGRFINSDDIENLEYLNGAIDLNIFAYTVNCPIFLTDGCGEGWLKDKIKKTVNKVKKGATAVVGVATKALSSIKSGIKKVCTTVGDFVKNTVWQKWFVNGLWNTFCKKWVWEKFCKEMVYNTFLKKWIWETFCKKWTWETFCKKWVWETFCKKWVWETFCKKWVVSAWNWIAKSKAGQITWNSIWLGVSVAGLIVSIIGCGSPAAPIAIAGVVLSAISTVGAFASLMMAIFA